MERNIAIYLNSAGFGGAEMLLLRFCTHLTKNSIPHYVVSEPDTFFGTELENNGTIVISARSAPIRATHYFVPYSAMIREAILWASGFPEMKLLTWIISPNESFTPNLPFMGFALRNFGYEAALVSSHIQFWQRKRLINLKQKLGVGGGLLLMDGATKRVATYFLGEKIANSIPLLPIPSPTGIKRLKKHKKEDGVLNIGYLGRIENMKFSALSGFISNTLAYHSLCERVNLHLVGNGPRIDSVREACQAAGVYLFEYGFMENEAARKVIVENCDIGAAMGTAALDLAASGLPTIIIDPSLVDNFKPQEIFHFVHEIEEFTLGEYRDFPAYDSHGNTFRDVVSKLLSNRLLVSKEADYVEKHHDPENIFAKLLFYVFASDVEVGELIEDTASLTSYINLVGRFRRRKNFGSLLS